MNNAFIVMLKIFLLASTQDSFRNCDVKLYFKYQIVEHSNCIILNKQL